MAKSKRMKEFKQRLKENRYGASNAAKDTTQTTVAQAAPKTTVAKVVPQTTRNKKATDWCGEGKKILSNGIVLEGNFVNGQLHGIGKITYTDGNIYEGECEKGAPHGMGKKTFADGKVAYEGNFVYGKYEGWDNKCSYSFKGMRGLLYATLAEDVESRAMNATINLDGSINEKARTTKRLTKQKIYNNAEELAMTTKSILKTLETQPLKNEDIMQLFK